MAALGRPVEVPNSDDAAMKVTPTPTPTAMNTTVRTTRSSSCDRGLGGRSTSAVSRAIDARRVRAPVAATVPSASPVTT